MSGAPPLSGPDIFFEDLEAGAVTRYGGLVLEREAAVAFAREFDPQPFHVDEEAARASPAGRLIASGWHTAALQMRMLCDAWLLRSASLGAPGIDELRWLRPVAPGDTLSVRQTVLETRASRSRPDRGLVRFRLEILNQDGQVAQEQTHWGLFGRRGAMVEPHGAGPRAPAEPRSPEEPPGPIARPPRSFDEVEVGTVTPLGDCLFTAADVIRFARAFDPQPFHVDPEAAASGPFGALAASGWHTAAAWMSRLVAHRRAALEEAREAGEPPPLYGVSPGFRDLKWLRPVYAGEMIAFSTEVVGKRLSASRPGWGLVFSRNTGRNEAGELVFEFAGSGFMACRGVRA